MKYMLLMNYGGADCEPMTEWAPDEIHEHMAFQQRLGRELTDSGEWVDGQGLAAPELAKFVKSDGQAPPVVTDGPFPESKELLAGYWLVDVESEDRAIEIAAKASAAPGPGGAPIRQTIEVRQVLSVPASEL
jgi:hypothetical protein